MVEKEQTVSAYRSHKETFGEEIHELNKALREMEVNCEVFSHSDEDGEKLIFTKIDI